MKTLFFLKAKCVQCGKDFYIRHDYAADDRWVLTYGVTEIPFTEGSGGEGIEINYGAVRIGPQYRCPHCGNDIFIRCGKCREYTCHPGGDIKEFKCAHCGNEGQIGGHIESVEAKNTGSGQ